MPDLKFGETAVALHLPAYIRDKLTEAGMLATLVGDSMITVTDAGMNLYQEKYGEWVWLPKYWFVESLSDREPTIKFYLRLTSEWRG